MLSAVLIAAQWSLAHREGTMGQALAIKLGKHTVPAGKVRMGTRRGLTMSRAFSSLSPTLLPRNAQLWAGSRNSAFRHTLALTVPRQTKGGKYPYLYSQCQAVSSIRFQAVF